MDQLRYSVSPEKASSSRRRAEESSKNGPTFVAWPEQRPVTVAEGPV